MQKKKKKKDGGMKIKNKKKSMKNFEEFIKENADSEESINKILDKKKEKFK